MVYKVDKSKPHILDRFISLGKVASPTFEDGRLVINSIFGHNYELGLDYTSKIIFQCSQDEQKPTLLRVNGPSYEFIWRTKSACPKTKFACSIPSGNDTLLVPSRDITIEMNRQNASYSFSLCADNYKLCINDSCINNNFLRQVQQHGGKSHIRLKLNDPTECKNDSVLREINVSLECDPRQQDATVSNLSGSNCQRNLVVRTKIACKNVKTIRTIDENLKITNGSIDKDSYDEAGKNNHSIENNETVLQMDEHHHSDINNKLNKQEDGSKQPTINEDKETIIQSIEGNKNSNASEQNKNVYETVKTTSKESQIAKEKSKENVQNKYKEVEYQKCDSIESENGKFSLKNIEPFSIRSKSSYLINFHGSSPECGGSVCKNGIVILPFVKKCPVVSYEDTYIKLSFSEEGMCPFTGNQKLLTDPHSFLIQILLKCNESSHFGSLLEEDTCKLTLFTKEIVVKNCPMLLLEGMTSSTIPSYFKVVLLGGRQAECDIWYLT
ncbi:hypothetical protein HHI36_022739 [Cryptolaemus montrouzieri]|uniref:MRH domain-containing protein n=1 Tax=Cryptolaemus montrouzieri TaxID=559131 RepID=A0ABD2N0N5_9CUCU